MDIWVWRGCEGVTGRLTRLDFLSDNFIGKIVGANTAINVCRLEYRSNLLSGNFIGKTVGPNTAI